MMLNTTIQFRCERSLVSRLKRIAERQRKKHLTLAREELEKYVMREEQKQSTRDRLQKKAA